MLALRVRIFHQIHLLALRARIFSSAARLMSRVGAGTGRNSGGKYAARVTPVAGRSHNRTSDECVSSVRTAVVENDSPAIHEAETMAATNTKLDFDAVLAETH
ncbi:MAG: hypothetical protein KDA38_17795, partial [Planctomycetales bacterium]|nr:hypothetical protein [Planctomycetales bacterium]